ncbi:MAG: choice-of-anchor B family protein, partial [Candidatus Neomarinimicrobiota bacterium]
VQDLSNPTVLTTYEGPTPSIDHNNYIIGDKVYMSHYTSGLRILDISNISSPNELAFFDVYQPNDNTSFDGTWSNYPYFESGSIAVTSIDEGLFILKPSESTPGQAPSVTYAIPDDGSVNLYWDLIGDSSSKINIYRSLEQGFTPSSTNFLDSVDYPGVEYTDSGLDKDVYYHYRTSVSNSGFEGPFSDELSIKPEFIPNQPPTIDTPSDIFFDEDSEYTLNLTGVSYGSDINPQNITITASSDNTDLFTEISVDQSLPEKLVLSPNQNKNGSSIITVKVKDDGGVVSGGIDETVVSFNATVLPVNDPPSSFNVVGEWSTGNGQYIPGSDSRTIFVNPENVDNDSIRFEWQAAEDVDGDNLQYLMTGEQGLDFLTMSSYTPNTSVTWSLKDIIAQTDTISVTEGSWHIVAFDGAAETLAFAGGQLRIDGRQLIPKILEIKQSYPNPFRNFTTIKYDVPLEQNVVLRVFNIRGQVVRTLVNELKGPGYYSVIWDGANDNGNAVSSGIYFCQMYTPANPNGGQFIKAMKMVKIR